MHFVAAFHNNGGNTGFLAERSAILVFAAVIVGGELFGVVGMLVFIPLTSVCFTIAKAVVELKLKKKNIPDEKLK